MQWGMPTLVELPDIEANERLCKELGLDFVEINMNLPQFQPDELEKLMVERNIFYTIHLDENFCPADFNSLIAQAWMDTLRQTLREAKRLNAPIVNMHMSKGVYFTMPSGKVFLFERYQKEYLERMRNVRKICADELAGSNTRVCIENTGGYMDFQKTAAELLLESEVFGLTWDIGHWHKGKLDDAPFMLSHRERIAHFHIHDAGASGDHLPLGTGDIDLNEMLAMAHDLNARCVLETKTAESLEKSVQWLSANGWL